MIHLSQRRIFKIGGEDRISFLQGIITADIHKLTVNQGLYSCLLSPQGKILHDFFLYALGAEILLDVDGAQADALFKKLKMYRLRAAVTIEVLDDWSVYAAIAQAPEVAAEVKLQDPRLEKMGWRVVSSAKLSAEEGEDAYTRHRIACAIPEHGDYLENRAYPAEYGLEALGAVSATKGCYVGQEVVARSRSRGTLHRLLHQVTAESNLPPVGTPILSGDREVGVLTSAIEKHGLAVLRLDAVEKSRTGEVALMFKDSDIHLEATKPAWI